MTGRPDHVVLVVQPEHDDPPGLFGDWLVGAGCLLDVRRMYAGDELPPLEGYAGLLVMGGAMSANDDHVLSWIGPVKDLVRNAAADGVPSLGVCLGHQLIAAALGGEVAPNPLGSQIGLYDVGWTREAAHDPLFATLATARRGMQWNDDLVVRLPPGAVVLAQTERAEPQAVRYRESMWGVQLHPEADAATVATWASPTARVHLTAKGVDADRLLGDLAAARGELDEAWRPLAVGFAGVVQGS